MKTKPNRFLVILMMPLMLVSQYACSKNGTAEKKNPEEKKQVVNPIFQADPTILYHDGVYYLYGTNDKNADAGFLVYSSADKMKSWKLNGYALRKGDAFGEWGFWAPHVWKYNGKFYMAYTANEKIAVAESNHPTGPFTQAVKAPLVSALGQIDPFIFIDDDGKKYLYYVKLDGGNKIWVAEMDNDFSAIKANTDVMCITVTPGTWEHVNSSGGRVAEGPTVIKQDGKYYLFYSANDFHHKDYAVGYAVSNSVYGPWIRYEGNPVVHQSITGNAGSGHGDIIKVDDDVYYVFHTHYAPGVVLPRKTAIIKLNVRNVNGSTLFQADKSSFQFLNLKN